MSKKIIHVNQHNIKFNAKHGETVKPVFTVKEGKKNTYTNEVIIHGPSKIVYTPEKPLSCGARAYIITEAEVEIKNPMTFQQTKSLCPSVNAQRK